jgi:enamine deaminase RidA (YjgF/YER057c/UK114 family)
MTQTARFTDDAGWQDAAGYSRAVRRGNIVVVSGTTAHGPDGAVLHPGDTAGQAQVCLSRIERALTALGATLADVVRTGVYLAPGANWEQAARVHHDVFADIRPASTMLFVAELIGDGFLVEVEAQAVVSS